MLRVAIDIGGTFTDISIIDDETGTTESDKVLTTPDDPSRGVFEALECAGVDLEQVWFLVHGTTVAINALIQGGQTPTGLITTRGFEDILEVGRGNRPVFFDIDYHRPPPLAPRRARMGVSERLEFTGKVLEPLDAADVERAVDALATQGIEALAVCFLHSFKNPAHERAVAAVVTARHPHIDVSLSSEVLPEIREYERTSTTVANAYLRPIVRGYLASLDSGLRGRGGVCRLHIMQSNGGVMSAEVAGERPVQVIESGPVGGAVATAHMGSLAGHENAIAFDMGGTTSKASVIHQGQVQTTTEYWPAGYMVKIPVIDIIEVGIGGGSIGSIDVEGLLTVGPRSAGADPGPVCYDRGGTEVTITDANAILGRVTRLVGGRLVLNAEAALEAFRDGLSCSLDMDAIAVASGMLDIAVAKIADAIRTVTVTRGVDPREHALYAFGGAGPMHAAFIARELDIALVVVPPAPGTFSGLGFLCSDFRHDFVRTCLASAAGAEVVDIAGILAELSEHGVRLLETEGFKAAQTALQMSVDVRYVGQAHEVNVPVQKGSADMDLTRIVEDFHRRHDAIYGHASPEEQVELVNCRVTAIGSVKRPKIGPALAASRGPLKTERQVYFGRQGGWLASGVYDRLALVSGDRVVGPAIIEEHTATVVVPPGFVAEADDLGSLLMRSVERAVEREA